jgi:murein DD-endopeptidase MepM/ murein hydrolase activator NlpD
VSAPLLAELDAAAAVLVGVAATNSLLGSVLFGLVLGICTALGARLRSLQYALWGLVMIRLFLPPGLSHPLGLGVLARSVFTSATWLGDEGNARPDDGSTPPAVDAASGGGGRVPRSLASVAVGPWAAGATVVATRARRRLRCVRRLLARSRPVLDAGVQRAVERFRRELGIRREIRVLSGSDQAVPFTVGLWRPTVYVPSLLLRPQWRRGLEAALAHELGHVARGDALTLHLLRAAQVLYFFHPVAWLVGFRLSEARERLCDSLVVSSALLPARRYAEGLVDVLGLGLRRAGAPALLSGRRRIAVRLRGILAESHRPRRQSFGTLVAASLIGVVLLPLAGAAPRAQAPATAPPAATPPAQITVLGNPLPEGRVSARFGPMVNPFTGKVDRHQGIDLRAPLGRPVLAAADGTAELATETYAPVPGAGRCVMLDHGAGLKTFYSHLESFAVKVGERVAKGQTIARVGNSGRSTAPHLHFEVWRDGKAIDPASMIPVWQR